MVARSVGERARAGVLERELDCDKRQRSKRYVRLMLRESPTGYGKRKTDKEKFRVATRVTILDPCVQLKLVTQRVHGDAFAGFVVPFRNASKVCMYVRRIRAYHTKLH